MNVKSLLALFLLITVSSCSPKLTHFDKSLPEAFEVSFTLLPNSIYSVNHQTKTRTKGIDRIEKDDNYFFVQTSGVIKTAEKNENIFKEIQVLVNKYVLESKTRKKKSDEGQSGKGYYFSIDNYEITLDPKDERNSSSNLKNLRNQTGQEIPNLWNNQMQYPRGKISKGNSISLSHKNKRGTILTTSVYTLHEVENDIAYFKLDENSHYTRNDSSYKYHMQKTGNLEYDLKEKYFRFIESMKTEVMERNSIIITTVSKSTTTFTKEK